MSSLGSSHFYIKGKFDVLDSTISDLLWKIKYGCAKGLCGIFWRLVTLINIGYSAGDIFIIFKIGLFLINS